ncbi:cystathionine gamma-synthase [Devosia sp. Root413D1]|uniref:trans-sulfuration enzyme family protein n=1 Tax=Devosia sp. Root413D1 TaxID=1736531 RepID=UPI000700D544|nr:aminotransferase class I/II-fold pyridoxal phosphate-dependent enzyme [Devosia sp. Root413D1]KQW85970.1 cystathionine gamma-synthase [Devosia sp. Root413D1]
MTNHLNTLALHGGDGARVVGEPLAPAPVLSTTYFTHPDAVGFSASDLEADAPHFYTRWSNPTLELLEKRLALLEGGEAALSFGSGMAAITGLFAGLLKAGDHLVLSDVCYAGVAEYARHALPRQGIEVSFADSSNPDNVAAALRPNTRLVHIETPANPILKLTDIAAVAAIAHAGGAELSVDSTIATPVGTNPIALGADYVCHSLTKYLCGHGDALGGAVIGRAVPIAALRKEVLIHHGAVLSPFSAYLILRGIETLGLRMDKHQANALMVAEWLERHPKVRRVLWPGLASHEQAELARRQMRNFSGLLSFSVNSDSAGMARQLAERLKLVSYAVSLGKTKSLCFYIPTEDILRSSFALADERNYRDWAGEGVFRVSVGIEDADAIIADFDEALK